MSADWLHMKPLRSERMRPALWWRQLEGAPRTTMPFAHLFPRPPGGPPRGASEAQRLARDLVPRPEPERMEDILQHYRNEPASQCEPVEASQIVSIGRMDQQEPAQWGPDGQAILEWFDHGDLLHALTPSEPEEEHAPPRGLARFVAWIKGLLPSKPMELANAEF